MRGSPSILLLIHNSFNKFNDTGARTLDSIYQMVLILSKHPIFGVKVSIF